MKKIDVVRLYALLVLLRRELLHVSEDAVSMLNLVRDKKDIGKYESEAEEIFLHVEEAFSRVKGLISKVDNSIKEVTRDED